MNYNVQGRQRRIPAWEGGAGDAEYQVDWAQCSGRLGPYPASAGVPTIECDAPVYKSEKLVTKKGDAASRTIKFVLPPEAGCWLDENAPLPGAEPSK
jgi:hypothetical protein